MMNTIVCPYCGAEQEIELGHRCNVTRENKCINCGGVYVFRVAISVYALGHDGKEHDDVLIDSDTFSDLYKCMKCGRIERKYKKVSSW